MNAIDWIEKTTGNKTEEEGIVSCEQTRLDVASGATDDGNVTWRHRGRNRKMKMYIIIYCKSDKIRDGERREVFIQGEQIGDGRFRVALQWALGRKGDG